MGVQVNSFCFVSLNNHHGQTAKLERIRKRSRKRWAILKKWNKSDKKSVKQSKFGLRKAEEIAVQHVSLCKVDELVNDVDFGEAKELKKCSRD